MYNPSSKLIMMFKKKRLSNVLDYLDKVIYHGKLQTNWDIDYLENDEYNEMLKHLKFIIANSNTDDIKDLEKLANVLTDISLNRFNLNTMAKEVREVYFKVNNHCVRIVVNVVPSIKEYTRR